MIRTAKDKAFDEQEILTHHDQALAEPQDDLEDMDENHDRPFSRRDMRSLAFHLIYAAEQFDYTLSLDAIVDNFRRGYEIEIPSNSPAIDLAREAIENRERFDEEVKPYLKNWKIERLGLCTRLILRLSLAELEHKDAIPTVVINEAVELAKAFAEKDAYKFVNGVLDQLVKEKNLGQAELELDAPALQECSLEDDSIDEYEDEQS